MDDLSEELSEAWSEQARAFLVALKAERRLTYGRMAAMCGLPKSTVSGILLGADKITARALVHFSEGLEVSADAILGIGTGVAASLPRNPAKEGGVLDLSDLSSRRRFLVPITRDLPELELRAGDLLEFDCAAEPEVGKIVAVLEAGGVSRLYRVRSISPGQMMLDRDSGPAVEFNTRYHTLQGRAVRMERRDP